jgi:Fe-S-cluster containining protein
MPEKDDGCSRCGACCKGLVLPFKPSEYLLARGGVALNDPDGAGVWVPSVCPHLKSDLCDIYDKRPLLCRNEYLTAHNIGSYRPKGCTRYEVE